MEGTDIVMGSEPIRPWVIIMVSRESSNPRARKIERADCSARAMSRLGAKRATW
jgi:hypothetical protein